MIYLNDRSTFLKNIRKKNIFGRWIKINEHILSYIVIRNVKLEDIVTVFHVLFKYKTHIYTN